MSNNNMAQHRPMFSGPTNLGGSPFSQSRYSVAQQESLQPNTNNVNTSQARGGSRPASHTRAGSRSRAASPHPSEPEISTTFAPSAAERQLLQQRADRTMTAPAASSGGGRPQRATSVRFARDTSVKQAQQQIIAGVHTDGVPVIIGDEQNLSALSQAQLAQFLSAVFDAGVENVMKRTLVVHWRWITDAGNGPWIKWFGRIYEMKMTGEGKNKTLSIQAAWDIAQCPTLREDLIKFNKDVSNIMSHSSYVIPFPYDQSEVEYAVVRLNPAVIVNSAETERDAARTATTYTIATNSGGGGFYEGANRAGERAVATALRGGTRSHVDFAPGTGGGGSGTGGGGGGNDDDDDDSSRGRGGFHGGEIPVVETTVNGTKMYLPQTMVESGEVNYTDFNDWKHLLVDPQNAGMVIDYVARSGNWAIPPSSSHPVDVHLRNMLTILVRIFFQHDHPDVGVGINSVIMMAGLRKMEARMGNRFDGTRAMATITAAQSPVAQQQQFFEQFVTAAPASSSSRRGGGGRGEDSRGGGGGRGRGGGAKKCSTCGNNGHLAADCYARRDTNGNPIGGGGGGRGGGGGGSSGAGFGRAGGSATTSGTRATH